MAVYLTRCKITISVRAVAQSLSLSMEIILTILVCFKGFHTPGMTKLRREVILDKAMELIQNS